MKIGFNSNARFLTGGAYHGGKEWTMDSTASDRCFKIYYFKQGESIIHSCDETFNLLPGNLYFINGYSIVRQECPNSMSVDWFHFQLESLYLEKILKSASCVISFDVKNLLPFIHIFEKLESFFHHWNTEREERIATLEIHSLIQYIIARVIDERNIDISGDDHNFGRLLPALDFINNNYHSAITLGMMAELCHYSPNYFNRLFSRTFDITPLNYIQKRRMEEAKRLLVYSDMRIKEIAIEAGYEDAAYFSRLFSRLYAVSPGRFRLKNRRELP